MVDMNDGMQCFRVQKINLFLRGGPLSIVETRGHNRPLSVTKKPVFLGILVKSEAKT